ncbi:MAG: proline hydroxylase [Rhodocyclales bacterium]|nr:proline hydroxylase [Rhodocyclales bacterium]
MNTGSGNELAFGDVRIIDGVMPNALHQELAIFFQEPIWFYGWKSNAQKAQAPNSHWNVFFAGTHKHETAGSCEAELMDNEFFKPVQDLWLLLKAGSLAGHEPVRVYANAHTYGTDGYVHTDSEDRNYYSTICYMHLVWRPDWAGELVFFNQDRSDITHAVYPRPGRIVSFHGAVPHCARPLSRDCSALRISLVYKTRKISGADA